MVLTKLAISNFFAHRVRLALTIAAVALSVSLVVAVTSGYASAHAAAQSFLERFIGTVDAEITRQNDNRGAMSQEMVAQIEANPDVERVTARLETELMLSHVQTAGLIRPAQVIGIRRPHDKRADRLKIVDGEWFDGDQGSVAVIDQVASEVLNLRVGDTIVLPGGERKLPLEVVAIVHKPGFIASQVQTVYVPLRTLQKFLLPDQPNQVNRVMIELEDGADTVAFVSRWTPKLKAIDPLLRIRATREHRSDLEKNLQTMQLLSYLGGTVSMVAATFIIFSALSMGVTERQRTLAMLRAIGMERSRVGWLVVIEGLILAALGVIIGIPLGIAWVKILVSLPVARDLLTEGVAISRGGLLFGAIGSMLAALVASFLPAWSAMRARPLAAMSPLAATRHGAPWRIAIVGLVLIFIDTFLMFGPIDRIFLSPETARVVRFYGHFFLGLPGVMMGFFLLAPMFVIAIERVFGRLVAPLLGLRYALLRQQLSSGVWRAAGTCAALMVGLSILIVMQTQGNSMLSGWKLPNKFPDIFIAAPPLTPLDEQRVRLLSEVPGIKDDELMPIAIASPEFGSGVFALAGMAFMPDATMFFGVDPDKAFKLMELDFREGTPEQAQAMLKKGRHVIVTEEFRQLKGLHVGDKLALKTPRHGTVEYTVAGVVWSPGMDVIVSTQDLGRQFDKRTAASVFGSLEDAKEDFGVERVYLFAANLEYHVSREQMIQQVRNKLGLMGMQAYDVRQVKHAVTQAFQQVLMLVSSVAFAAMAVASLGVTNTIMASIRSRRWQFGILRSIGATRGQLLRLVLAEAVLLGLVGCGLGLAAGALMTLNARGFSRHTIGYIPPVDVPWNIVGIGTGLVMLIAILASLWPATSVSRAEPLRLLQAGRASA
ncbi:MAG TPA: FtsX-like permease family protein [Tepidisphaeraceae bacterium]|nr:FtsX-like permease family protein [Tepidisphaeraceae bacterium]